ncbi:UNVERIFIED_ORG: transposase [Clostridium botulinum]|uniref:helix-turn-helix domain-containing protein n=1 Tax=Clostridium sp. ZBS13 TaxID=2949971 RepID=UPI000A172FF1|nr:helix-turn-helix domain-containing protein [Clostridium sp. ZBS13]
MGRKSKISPEIKIKVVEDYLEGKDSLIQISKKLYVNPSSVRAWIRKYKTFGSKGLIPTNSNTVYKSDIKIQAVTDFLEGKGSLYEICIKYNISAHGILQSWVKQYNSGHKIFKSHRIKDDRIMTNGRKTTHKERIEIVSFCIANANDYKLAANTYTVSYQQVYTWTKKYEKNGIDALVDRRGKEKIIDQLSESDKIAAQLKLLEAENRRLKLENDFLKKLKEIERR